MPFTEEKFYDKIKVKFVDYSDIILL
jgi:hypothetical protein